MGTDVKLKGSFPEWLDKDEAKIINRLITAALKHPANLMVRVYDGEEWATDWTRNRATIQAQVAQTDATRLYFMEVADNGAATRLGSILLIHGNGEDVISDASWVTSVPAAEHVIESLCAHANA